MKYFNWKLIVMELVKATLRAFMLLGIFVFLNGILHYFILNRLAYFEPKLPLKDITKWTQPMTYSNSDDRYCSSVTVDYKDKNYTLTNAHCCEVFSGQFDDVRKVGNVLETILLTSTVHDICILTSRIEKSPIKLAEKEFEHLDKALVFGYPRGENLTPEYGFVVALSKVAGVCCDDEGQRKFKPSNFLNALIFGGNSGSPVFNENMELVNLVYAGPVPEYLNFTITVPLTYIKEALEQAHEIQP